MSLFRTAADPLADGDYRLTLDPAGVRDAAGNTLREPGSLDFFVLAGDANRDRVVSLADFLILRANFGTNLPPPPSASPLPGLFAGGGKDGEEKGGRGKIALLR